MEKRVKQGQVTLFIIIAIAVVGIIAGYAIFKYQISKIPAKFEPVEQYFLDCVNARAEEGAGILGQKAGHIDSVAFESGSGEWPASNHLGFMGDSIPYWFYVSGNGILKERLPTISSMEKELASYLQDTLPLCDFSEFFDKGYDVSLDVKTASVDIRDSQIIANVNADLKVEFENETASISSHTAKVSSKLGKFYNLAFRLYNKEKTESFLENFTVELLYAYAPTTDTELTCSPKVWLLSNISEELKNAFESNFLFLSPKAKNKYFSLDITADESFRFLYNREWPTKIYAPSENGLLIAKPIGIQQGLGVLGFCLAPYHFVYDMNFPILVQIYDEKEFFQFPVSIVIRGNRPRSPLEASAVENPQQSACQYKPTKGIVSTYDSELNPIEADIQFKCFSESCSIGSTKTEGSDARLESLFPQCVNGIVIAAKEGYIRSEEIVSSNNEFDVGLILDKLYSLNVNLKFTGRPGTSAIVYLESGKNNQVIYWPEQRNVQLSEGFYNVTVQVYSNSSITFPETKTNKCFEIPEPGFLGLLGKTTEKCIDMTIPEQKIANAVIGGGKSQEYFIASQLKSSSIIEITIPETSIPQTIDEVQAAYDKVERAKVNVNII